MPSLNCRAWSNGIRKAASLSAAKSTSDCSIVVGSSGLPGACRRSLSPRSHRRRRASPNGLRRSDLLRTGHRETRVGKPAEPPPPPPPDKLTYLSEDTDPSQRQINDQLFRSFQAVTGTIFTVIHEDPITKIEQIKNGDYDIALLNDIVLVDQFDEHLSNAAFLDFEDNQFTLTNRAVAYFWTDLQDVGLLYYRKDLVGNAPQTWEDLEQKASDIQNSQQNDKPGFVAFAWPGDAGDKYEGLTCNALQ